ncbi:MAG: hypothetical protein ABSF77_19440 [Spirochaetia bacterium]
MAPAIDWEAFASGTDPSLDPALLQVLASGDQETDISVYRGLAMRSDPSVGAFIEALALNHLGDSIWRTELYLRVLLEKLFDPGLGEEALQTRIKANSGALDMMFSRISDWQNPQLLDVLTRIAPRISRPSGTRAVMDVGQRIISELYSGKGFLLPQETSLAMDYLAAVDGLANQDFLPQCAEIARLSRDKALVETARSTAKKLALLR